MFPSIRPLAAAAILACGFVGARAATAVPSETGSDSLFGVTRLHKVALTLSRAEWTVLVDETVVNRSQSAGGGPAGAESDVARADGRIIHIGGGFAGTFPWVTADVRIGPLALKETGLRYKGNSSYNASVGSLHRNLKLKTDFHGGTAAWEGETSINFNAGVLDASRVRESFSYEIFRAAGVPAPRTALAEVTASVPGVHSEANLGLYTVVENVGARFLRRVLPPGTGLLLKPEGARVGIPYLGESWDAYENIYRPERPAAAEEQRRVIEFAWLVNIAPVSEFRERIASFLDLEAFLRYIAVNALLVNHDSFLRGSHNYYLYLDRPDGRFQFIPWDEDLSLGNFLTTSPGAELNVLRPWVTDNPLLERVLSDPAHANRYRVILKDLTRTVFSREKVFPLLDQLEAAVKAPLAAERAAADRRADRFAGNARLGQGPSPRAFLESRLRHLATQLGPP